jgi:hypothetical protein
LEDRLNASQWLNAAQPNLQELEFWSRAVAPSPETDLSLIDLHKLFLKKVLLMKINKGQKCIDDRFTLRSDGRNLKKCIRVQFAKKHSATYYREKTDNNNF